MSRILIVGGGYGGLRAATVLASRLDRGWSIEMIEPRAHHELLTRLPEVAAGALGGAKARISYADILPKRVRHIRETAHDIDPERMTVWAQSGSLQARYIVVAMGAVTDYLQVPGAREHSVTLRSVDEAERLQAALGAGRRAGLKLRVLIVGAGYTGTEMAGELSSRSMQEFYDVQLLAEDARLLPQGNERLAYAAEKRLRTRGVRLTLGCRVERVDTDGVVVNGSRLPADVVIWAARTVPASPAPDHFRHGPDRRIAVDDFLRAVGFPQVYALGDVAHARDFATGAATPANAQLALQEADIAAGNILADIEGSTMKPFRPRSLGEALSLGPDDAAAEVAGVVVTGRAALAVKRAALARYLYELGGPRLVARYLR